MNNKEYDSVDLYGSENYEDNCNSQMTRYIYENVCIGDENFPIIQINGRRVYGPPNNWTGPVPQNDCELYIKRIPKNMNEQELLQHFKRFGNIYELRLMIDYNYQLRGYGYIKFSTEIEALRAMEVMNHFITPCGKKFEVQKSYDKCRLFVGNLPRDLYHDEIENAFKITFPEMTQLVMHNRISEDYNNRGFAFIDFPNHKSALNAKRQCSSGILPMWERDIKIIWANQERTIDSQTMSFIKTLFVRNVDLSVNQKEFLDFLLTVVPNNQILKVSRVREYAFVDCINRKTAEFLMNHLQGKMFKGHQLSFEWAKPPSNNSVHSIRTNDFDAILRLKCLANYWHIPIFIYGQAYENDDIQYVSVSIKKYTGETVTFFLKVNTRLLIDIQSRICEAIIQIIKDYHGKLPIYNLVLILEDSCVNVVGQITNFFNPTFNTAVNIHKKKLTIHWNDMKDLIAACFHIQHMTFEHIEGFYHSNLMGYNNFIENIFINQTKILGCVNPLFRQRPPLKFNLNNTQIIFTLCDVIRRNNYLKYQIIKPNNLCEYVQLNNVAAAVFKPGILYKSINLLPLHFVQSKHTRQPVINQLRYGYPYTQLKAIESSPTHQHPSFKSFLSQPPPLPHLFVTPLTLPPPKPTQQIPIVQQQTSTNDELQNIIACNDKLVYNKINIKK